jgi:hypothetical protein
MSQSVPGGIENLKISSLHLEPSREWVPTIIPLILIACFLILIVLTEMGTF